MRSYKDMFAFDDIKRSSSACLVSQLEVCEQVQVVHAVSWIDCITQVFVIRLHVFSIVSGGQ